MSDEINMSLEETNEVRKKLGLPLLARPAKEVESEEAESTAKAEEDAIKRLEDAEAKKQAKDRARKKAHKAKTSGPSLGKMLVDQRGSAADWVARMRKKDPNTERAKALRLAEELEKQDALYQPEPAYTASDLANLRVRHDTNEFEKGQDVILTLKDEHILKDGGANDAEDELENVNLVDRQRDQRNYDRKTKRLGYNPLEETDVLLSHYDDEKDYAGNIRLDSSGAFDAKHAKRLAHMEAQAKAAAENRTLYDLNADDEEAPLRTKPVAFKKKRKKKKKTGDDPYAFLKEQSAEDRAKDHGNRSLLQKTRLEKIEADRKKALKDQSYMAALQRAEEAQKSSSLVLDEEEDNYELEASLARARRVRTNTSAHRQNVANPSARIVAYAQAKNTQDEKIKTEPGVVKLEGAPVLKVEEDGVAVTTTTNFCAHLATYAEGSVRVTKVQQEGKIKEETPNVDGEGDVSMEIDENEDTSDDEDQPKKSGDEDSEEDRDLLTEEVDLRFGMAAVLQLAKDRGILESREEQSGRARDASLFLNGEEDPAPHLSIDKYDAYGRVLKPKEAFRNLSHKFHGRGPGTAKREKAHKRFREDMKARYIDKTLTEGTAAKLTLAQQRTGVSFITLDKYARVEEEYVVPTGHTKGSKKRKKEGKGGKTKKVKT